MESSSEANRVQCTKETAELIKRDTPEIGVHFRKRMDIKGRGFLDTYFLTAPAKGFGSIRPKKDPSKRKVRRSIGDMRSSASALLRSGVILEEDFGDNSERTGQDSLTSYSETTGHSLATGALGSTDQTATDASMSTIATRAAAPSPDTEAL